MKKGINKNAFNPKVNQTLTTETYKLLDKFNYQSTVNTSSNSFSESKETQHKNIITKV